MVQPRFATQMQFSLARTSAGVARLWRRLSGEQLHTILHQWYETEPDGDIVEVDHWLEPENIE